MSREHTPITDPDKEAVGNLEELEEQIRNTRFTVLSPMHGNCSCACHTISGITHTEPCCYFSEKLGI